MSNGERYLMQYECMGCFEFDAVASDEVEHRCKHCGELATFGPIESGKEE